MDAREHEDLVGKAGQALGFYRKLIREDDEIFGGEPSEKTYRQMLSLSIATFAGMPVVRAVDFVMDHWERIERHAFMLESGSGIEDLVDPDSPEESEEEQA